MAAKKTSAKSTRKPVKKKPVKVAPKKLPIVKDSLTKGGIIKGLIDMTALAKKDVVSVLDGLGTLIELHIKSRGPGKFILPGLMKIHVVKKPATPARKGKNPFTGEDTV